MISLVGHAILKCSLFVAGLSSALVLLCGTTFLASTVRSERAPRASAYQRLAIVTAISAVSLVLSIAITLMVIRTTQISSQSSLTSWAGFRHMFGRILSTEDQGKIRLAEFAALEPIDAHTHIAKTSPEFVAMLERLHVHVLDILVINDRRPYRASLEPQRQDASNFIASSVGHASLCTTFDPFQLSASSFSQAAIEGLNADFARGAVAVKVWKNIGMEIKNDSGQYVMPDDPVFEPIYKDIAAHNKTLIVHAAALDAAWTAQYITAAEAKYYGENPDWNMSKNPNAPRKQDILEARNRMLAANPELRVIGAHLGSMEGQLVELAHLLDRYPNFAVDTAARVDRLTFEPRDQVRAFFLKYQDRILYGSDSSFGNEDRHNGTTPASWEEQYLLDWRYFSTDDTFDYHGHTVEGLDLPLPVLEKLYHDNAVRWIPGIDSNVD